MTSRKFVAGFMASCAWAGLMAGSAALAAEGGSSADAAAEHADSADSSESIVVTGIRLVDTSISATKSNTPLVETPQSISVVDLEDLRARSVLSLGDALTYTAGVFANTKGVTYGGDALSIRGFGNDGTTGAAPNTYIDGLRLGGTGYVSGGFDPYLYDRIEVVKGPASVLFGQSVPGGLVNMVSKRPKDEFGGELLLRIGSFDRKQVGIDVTGPLTASGDVTARIAGTWFETEDMYPFSHRNRVLIAPSLTWKIGEDTSLTVLTHYQEDDFDGSTLNWLPTIGTVIDNPNGTISRELFTGDPNYQRWDRETASAGYQFEHRFSDLLTFRQNLRYTHTKLDNRNIYINRLLADRRTASRQVFGLKEYADDLTIDNHAAFTFATGPVSHKLLVGLDWQRMKSGTDREVILNGPTLDVFAPVYFQTIGPRNFFRKQDYNPEQTGLYAQDQISLGGWRLLVGVRQDWASSKTYDYPTDRTLKTKNKALTTRVGLLYKFDNGLAPYASFSESFVPQYGTDARGATFDPERGRQYELGVKYQPGDGKSMITASLFDLRRRNYVTPDPDNVGFGKQTGDVRMRGLELEANVDLTAGFSAVAAYTLLDSRVTSSNDTVSGINPETLAVEARRQQGLRLMAVPRHNASLWLNYASPAGVIIGAGARHSSFTYGDAANLSRVPAFTLFDASLRVDLGKWVPSLGGLELSAKVNNLFDKTYVSSCAGIDRCYYGQARNGTIDLAWRW
jgi:iron complex outermembrane recepter protein